VKAFTLIEMLLSTMLGGMVVGVVAFIFANMAGSFAEQPTTGVQFDWDVNGNGSLNDPIPYSPAYSQLSQAFLLQAEITDALQSTENAAGGFTAKNGGGSVSAVYVISSDEGENLPVVPAGTDADVATLPVISGVAPSLLASSASFYASLNQAGSGVSFSAQAGYSIYFMSGDDDVKLAVHCRRTTSGTDTLYTVKTYSGGNFCPSLSYGFGIRNLNSTVQPSAHHIRLRTNGSWGIAEDLGTRVVLPDPTVVAYEIRPGDDASVRTFSRFAILLPIKP
jgi:hypothetical protein